MATNFWWEHVVDAYLQACAEGRDWKEAVAKAEREIGNSPRRVLTSKALKEERGLVLNKTNNRALRGAFGDDVDGWKGKIIIIFPTMVDMRGKMTPALRVRIPSSKGGNGPAVAVPPHPPPPTPSAQQQLDEFGQAQSPEKPSLSDDLDDEIGF